MVEEKPDSTLFAEEFLQLLSRKGTIWILFHLSTNRVARYETLRSYIPNESTLSRRLDELVEYGCIQKKILDEKYRPIQYIITQRGRFIFDELEKIRNEFKLELQDHPDLEK